MALCLLRSIAGLGPLHSSRFSDECLVCGCNELRVVHGREDPQWILLDRRAGWRVDVHSRRVLLPRASSEDQYLVRCDHRLSVPRASHHRLYHQQTHLARRVLGEYCFVGLVLALSRRSDGRNDLQPSYPRRAPNRPKVSYLETTRCGAVAE